MWKSYQKDTVSLIIDQPVISGLLISYFFFFPQMIGGYLFRWRAKFTEKYYPCMYPLYHFIHLWVTGGRRQSQVTLGKRRGAPCTGCQSTEQTEGNIITHLQAMHNDQITSNTAQANWRQSTQRKATHAQRRMCKHHMEDPQQDLKQG